MIDTNSGQRLFSLLPQQINLSSLLMSGILEKNNNNNKAKKKEDKKSRSKYRVYYEGKLYLTFCCVSKAQI